MARTSTARAKGRSDGTGTIGEGGNDLAAARAIAKHARRAFGTSKFIASLSRVIESLADEVERLREEKK